MIALDTNVLVRLLVRDDEAQALQARNAFDTHAEEDGLFVSDIVLAELCWVLSRSYGFPREDIAVAVRALLDNASIVLESPAVARQALKLFESGSADFPDCLIVAKAQSVGCQYTLSFDKRLLALPSVTQP